MGVLNEKRCKIVYYTFVDKLIIEAILNACLNRLKKLK